MEPTHITFPEGISGPKHTRKVLSYRKLQQRCDLFMLFALRDNNSLQQANRKLERKVKEMKMQTDEERINLLSQRDQVHTSLTTKKKKVTEQSGAADLTQCLTSVNSAADSEGEDGEEADGRGGGGDRASGTR